uniref:arginine--tRNA ligase n=1 Tax=Leptocylindrus danicus TaxID=163516 RepID=A0A6U2LX67_9STRA|mmetsp:Transcript_14306/g.21172  ORF Transcript_14306/g.21172 Transcript_14306/m.21172 type:complete len:753 (+) Transcript_14306:198-2456(+)|eukprot:CAMPEP_0116018218 /NCGR_PEP_ID=MMETSP0321-20121206/8514_1 /TAXON_ID=163516 /ORGANISM="Leptocylindrus danicus var. danicus, Strain B650" /LENGTH=752 /DNA_ID=CAMNT_0003488563 /DNA_START=187 /DNA_END=2445 /DNA_ORIENTATION=+
MKTCKVFSPTQKIVAAAKLVNVKLNQCFRGYPLANGSVLYTPNGSMIFGDNAILKYLNNSPLDYNIDEWLELERDLRASAKPDIILAKLDAHLASNSFLVGGSMSVADVAMICTLVSIDPNMDKFPSVQAFVANNSGNPIFEMAGTSQIQDVEMVVYSTILSLFPDVDDAFFEVPVGGSNMMQKAKDVKLGHYQCTAALKLFQILKNSKNSKPEVVKGGPKGLAQSIIDHLPRGGAVDTSTCNIAGPGFIMLRVSADYLALKVAKLIQSDGPQPRGNEQGESVLVDFSSPNIAKEMHVGHLRSTIIGESVSRILEFTGHKTHRINHVGDWGTQFGMLIEYLKQNASSEDISGNSVGDLTEFYRNAKQCFDEDEAFKKRSQLNVVALQSGDEECTKIWQTLCDISRASFEKVYSRLNCTLTECGESFYNPMIPGVIEKFKEAKLVTDDPSGAKLCFVDGHSAPLMLQKSDGGFGYDSTDMAALHYRIKTLKCSRCIYITDYTQSQHFQMCFAAADKIGWTSDDASAAKKVELMHIGFGTVMGEDNKRFKTRSGDTVKLVDLLDESSKRMEENLRERLNEKKANITEQELPGVARVLGYSAVKYFDLHRNPTSNYVFSYDRMLDTKGNTAIYLLYAHARLVSILAKAGDQFPETMAKVEAKESSALSLVHPSEVNLAYHINQFDEVLTTLLVDLLPYRICDYLYALSNSASDFVTKCKVLGSDEMETRLLLCKATGLVMRVCFDLLGLQYVMSI